MCKKFPRDKFPNRSNTPFNQIFVSFIALIALYEIEKYLILTMLSMFKKKKKKTNVYRRRKLLRSSVKISDYWVNRRDILFFGKDNKKTRNFIKSAYNRSRRKVFSSYTPGALSKLHPTRMRN